MGGLSALGVSGADKLPLPPLNSPLTEHQSVLAPALCYSRQANVKGPFAQKIKLELMAES
jgi:hypothetical protein